MAKKKIFFIDVIKFHKVEKLIIESKRVRPEKSEVQRLICDYSKAHKLSGWKPRYTLEEGLEKTIAWFRENLNIYKEGIYNF